MNKEQAMIHMRNGGQAFRQTPRDRFYYKIENGKLFCRCNELGSWHPSVELRDSDILTVSEFDYSYDESDRLIRTPIPLRVP